MVCSMVEFYNKKPKYLILIEDIIKMIRNGELLPGDKLPARQKLSQSFSVSEETVTKAFNELSDLGYINKIHRKGTFVNKIIPRRITNNISIIIPHIFNQSNSYHLDEAYQVDIHPALIQELQKQVYKAGLNPKVNIYNYDDDKETEFLLELKNGKVDGSFYFGFGGANNIPIISEYAMNKEPILFLDTYVDFLNIPAVASSNQNAVMSVLMDYLIPNGYEKIFCLTSGHTSSSMQERENGYKIAMSLNSFVGESIFLPADINTYNQWSEKAIEEHVHRIFRNADTQKTAIISLMPTLHRIFWKYAINHNFPIEKLAWCSFDSPNIDYPEDIAHLEIIQDLELIAKTALDKVIYIINQKRLGREDFDYSNSYIDTKIISKNLG